MCVPYSHMISLNGVYGSKPGEFSLVNDGLGVHFIMWDRGTNGIPPDLPEDHLHPADKATGIRALVRIRKMGRSLVADEYSPITLFEQFMHRSMHERLTYENVHPKQFVDAIALATNCPAYASHEWICFEDDVHALLGYVVESQDCGLLPPVMHDDGGFIRTRDPYFDHPDCPERFINIDDLDGVARIYQVISSGIGDNLEWAIDAWKESKSTRKYRTIALELRNAFEELLRRKITESMNDKKGSDRAAQLLGECASEHDEIRGDVKRIYNTCSKILHHRGSEIEWRDAVNAGQDLCRRAIMQSLIPAASAALSPTPPSLPATPAPR